MWQPTSGRIQVIYAMLAAVLGWGSIFLIFGVPFLAGFFILAHNPTVATPGDLATLPAAAVETFFLLLGGALGDTRTTLYAMLDQESPILSAAVHLLVFVFGLLVLLFH